MSQDFESNIPQRRTGDLRVLRFGFTGTHYFVTCCTVGRDKRLDNPDVWGAVLSEWKDLDESGDARLVAGVLMPDHVHWLFKLGGRLSLGRVVARFKARTRSALDLVGARWQANFFEHRLRDGELLEPFAFYMFMNPWRARLLSCDEFWSYWIFDDKISFEFPHLLRDGGLPKPEWITEIRNPLAPVVGPQSC